MTRLTRCLGAATLITLAITTATACSSSPTNNTAPTESGTVVVAAAASLTAGFQDVGKAFDAAHPGVTVQFNFAGSSTLVTQLINGAPADVFASADQANMDKAAQGGVLTGSPQVFARNRLAIVVPTGNPKNVAGLKDFARPELVASLCAPDVPAGKYARQALAKAGVAVPQGSQELDVKAVVSRVRLGQADLGIVYTTDVKDGGAQVTAVSIPDDQNVIASYPISLVKGGASAALAGEFIAFVQSTEGQRVLAGHGFLAP